MIAEYAHYYGGPPEPTTPWPLVVALYAKSPRFEARRQLTGYQATREAIGVAFSGKDEVTKPLTKRAYPMVDTEAEFRPNLAALGDEDDG